MLLYQSWWTHDVTQIKKKIQDSTVLEIQSYISMQGELLQNQKRKLAWTNWTNSKCKLVKHEFADLSGTQHS